MLRVLLFLLFSSFALALTTAERVASLTAEAMLPNLTIAERLG